MIKISNDYTKISFKGKSDLLDNYRQLVSKSHAMTPILKQIKNLKRGKVKPEDTKKAEI